jgi:hypothetical protein
LSHKKRLGGAEKRTSVSPYSAGRCSGPGRTPWQSEEAADTALESSGITTPGGAAAAGTAREVAAAGPGDNYTNCLSQYDKVPEAIRFRALAQKIQLKILQSKDAMSIILKIPEFIF